MVVDIVIISYSGNVERTVASLNEFRNHEPINIIVQSARQSIPLNVNAGFRQVPPDAEFFVLFNDDWDVTADGWLDEMLASAHNYEADLVSATFKTPRNGKILKHRGYFISENGMVGPIMDEEKAMDDYIENTTVCGKTIEYAHPVLIRASVFKELGGYDEQFKGSQYADMDFIYRSKKAGYRTYMKGTVELFHHFKENQSTNAVRIKHRQGNERLFRAKHGFGRRKMSH